MMRYRSMFLILILAVGPAVQTAQQPAPTVPIAITSVTIVDVEKGVPVPGQTVVVAGNRITAVGPVAQVAVPGSARVIDGSGKFLIPGLWDMHVHALEHYGIDYGSGDMKTFQLFVANGVTGVRDMGSSFEQLIVGKKRIESGRVAAPRIMASGPLLEAGQPALNMALISKFVPTPDAGRLAVRSLVEAGVDFLKIHNGLSRETYLAVTEEAKRRNIPFAGHVPSDVTITEASEVGQRSIEHLAPLTAVCVDAGALRGVEKNPDQPIAINQSKCREALRQLARNRTFLSPTLVSGAPRSADNVTETESRLHYIRAPKRAAWPRLSSELRPGAQVRHDLNLRLTRMASDAQVRLLPTTDTGGANRIPGWATLEELTLFTEAGLSPLESLRSATLNAAAYFNMTDSLGSIATGKLADLVMLDANPLADIRNLYRIAAVIANGRLFGSAARQKLLDDVAEAAR